MPLESLLVTRDSDVIQVLQQTTSKLSMDVEVCRGARSGIEILASEKFDAVIVDCDDLPDGVDVLKDLRKTPSNRSSVAFAILNGSTTAHQAFEFGATFVMQKPITPLNAMRCLSAGLGLMVRERRRYFRYTVELDVVFRLGQGDIKARTTNVSEGGMAIRTVASLGRGDVGNVTFTLPENLGNVDAKAELVWVDGHGRAGIRFLEMPKTSRQLLDQWLEEQILRVDPLPEVKRFVY